jgi:Spy/CpxP family protein refolding chaperone
MNASNLLVVGLLSAGLTAAGIAVADHGGEVKEDCWRRHQGPRHGPGPMGGGPDFHMFGQRMAEHLDLDEQQRSDIQVIRESYQGEFETLRQAMRDNREALHDAAESGSDQDVQRLAEAQGEYMAQTIVLGIRMRGEIDSVLTEEQRQAAKDHMERFRERRKEFKERRAGDRES